MDGNSAAKPSGLSPWQDWVVTLGNHFKVVSGATGVAAGALFFSLHFGQPGGSSAGTAWPATPPQQARGPQQHPSDGPRTLHPQRRTDSPSLTTTGYPNAAKH
jgi:hypothetical protein